jgi:hypothetical protein
MRMFAVADQRSITEIDIDTMLAVPCREVLMTADVRERAAALAADAAICGAADAVIRSVRDDPAAWLGRTGRL